MIDKNWFIFGIDPKKLKKCPGCSENSCYYIGGSDTSVECANKNCKFYKPYTETNRYKFALDKPYEDTIKEEKEEVKEILEEDDNDTKEIDPMDFGDMLGQP